MKPKFSILTLLGITAYIAVNVARLIQPNSLLLMYAPFLIILAAVIALLPIAAGPTKPITVFARGVFLGLGVYELGRALEPFDYAVLPFNFFDWPLELRDSTGDAVSLAMKNICYLNSYVVFGILGGTLALWHYRRQERRANQEKIR